MAVAVVASLFAAALYAVASALQHHSATDVSLGPVGGRALPRFIGRTLRHPVWLAGTMASALALVFHTMALHDGPLVLVQPLMVAGVTLAIPLRHWLDRRRPAHEELAWAAILVVSLAGFLLIAAPVETATAPADRTAAAVTSATIVVVGLTCIFLGRTARGTRPAVFLGIAAGLSFATTAALIKTTTDILTRHPDQVLTTWPPYALVAVGMLGLLLNQLAFQSGPLRSSLPAISVADPIASLVIGIVVYDERVRHGLMPIGLEVVLLGTVIAATIALTRPAPARGDQSVRPSRLGTARPTEKPA